RYDGGRWPRVCLVPSGVRSVDVDEYLVAVHLHGVDGHGPDRGQLHGLAGTHVELRAVQPALDEGALDLAVGQRDLPVGADVADGVVGALGVPHDRDGDRCPVDAVEL